MSSTTGSANPTPASHPSIPTPTPLNIPAPTQPQPPLPPKPKKPLYNSWTLETHIKTCKCTVCGERVAVSSQKCNQCGLRVCSECLDPDSTKSAWFKDSAKDRVKVGCWHCNYRGNMNPAFARRKPVPARRAEEERRAKAAKALGVARKAAAKVEGQVDGGFLASTGSEDSFIRDAQGPSVEPRPVRAGIKRKRYTGDEQTTPEEPGDRPEPPRNGIRLKLKRRHGPIAPESSSAESPETTNPVMEVVSGSMSKLPSSSVRSESTPDLKGGSTVIVGAGVVGLFVAYELATELMKAGVKHTITVVEIRESVSMSASARCAGILGTNGMPEEWSPLLTIAKKYWEQLVTASEETKASVGLVSGGLSVVAEGASQDVRESPAWLRVPDGDSLANDVEAFGRIDPTRLARWLLEQCEQMGVTLRFNHSIDRVSLTPKSAISHVTLMDIKQTSSEPDKDCKINCQNLILAAGPYTTYIFNTLFPHHAVQLQNNLQAAHWVEIPHHNPHSAEHMSVSIPHAAQEIERLENEILIRAHPDSLTISGIAKRRIQTDWESFHALEPPGRAKTRHLRSLAAAYLRLAAGMDITDKTACPLEGREELSTGNNGNPVVDRVPASGLGIGKEDGNPCGLWVCYGFGRFGTTLAPGAARMLVSRMLWGGEGIDNYDFSVPEYTKAKVIGNGKGNGKVEW